MNPVNIKAVARKEFYHLIRDFRSLYLAFIIPLLLALGSSAFSIAAPPIQTGQGHPFACTDYSQGKVFIVSADGKVDLAKLFQVLGGWEVTSVLVEGGGILLGSLFDEGLVDKVIAFIAPVIIGGDGGKTAVGGQGVSKMVDSFRLQRVRVERIGEDLMISGYIKE